MNHPGGLWRVARDYDATFSQTLPAAVLKINVNEGSTSDEHQQEGDQGSVAGRDKRK